MFGLLAAALTGVCSSSCSTASGNPTQDPGDAGSVDGLPVGEVSCVDDSRVDTYVAHLSKTGANGYRFEIESSDPAPLVKCSATDCDTLVLRVTDANGQAMAGDLAVEPYMPDHGHGPTIPPVVTFDSSALTYTVTPLVLFMPGVWRIKLTAYAGAADAGSPLDSAMFFFCIDG